jgi:hypothetical protein
MRILRERFMVDDTGRTTDVVVAVEDYERLKLRLSELEVLSARNAKDDFRPDNLDAETLARLRALFHTLSEEEIDQAEAGEGPYVWLIDLLEGIGLARWADEARATPDEYLPLDEAMAELDRRRPQ